MFEAAMTPAEITALAISGGLCLVGFDPRIIAVSDASNLLVAGAYMFGFPLAVYRSLADTPHVLWWSVAFGIVFVYLCGIGHVLDVLITHSSSPLLAKVLITNRVLTGLVAWAFVMAIFHATRTHGLRLSVASP